MIAYWEKINGVLHEVDPKSVDTAQPAVFILGGAYKDEKTYQDDVREYIHSAEHILGINSKSPRMICLVPGHWKECVRTVRASNADPLHFSSDAAKIFSDQIVLPRLTRADSGMRTLEEAKESARNLTFLGGSFGTTFAQEVAISTSKKLGVVGYSTQEAQQIMQEIFLLAISTISRSIALEDTPHFSSVYFVSANDRLAPRAMSGFEALIPVNHEDCTIQKINGNRLVVWTNTEKNITYWTDSEQGLTLRTADDPLAHGMPLFTERGFQKIRTVPFIIERTARNIISRTGAMPVEELLKIPPQLNYEYSAMPSDAGIPGYYMTAKIEEALKRGGRDFSNRIDGEKQAQDVPIRK